MIGVAALEAQGIIKKLDGANTWPHPTEPGYYVTSVFVRTEEDKPYLIYCPKLRVEIAINEESYNPFIFWGKEPLQTISKLELRQGMYQVDGVNFMIIPLFKEEPKEVKKSEIEKMFGVRVVD